MVWRRVIQALWNPVLMPTQREPQENNNLAKKGEPHEPPFCSFWGWMAKYTKEQPGDTYEGTGVRPMDQVYHAGHFRAATWTVVNIDS